MKKHLIGLLLAVATFTGGFVVSPVWYKRFGVSHGSAGYDSSWLATLGVRDKRFDSTDEAKQAFEQQISEAVEIVERQSETRVILVFYKSQDNQKGYCLTKLNDDFVTNICSRSLWQILDFEKSERKF